MPKTRRIFLWILALSTCVMPWSKVFATLEGSAGMSKSFDSISEDSKNSLNVESQEDGDKPVMPISPKKDLIAEPAIMINVLDPISEDPENTLIIKEIEDPKEDENKPVISISQKEEPIKAPVPVEAQTTDKDKKRHLFWPRSLVYHFSFGEKLPGMLKSFCDMQEVNAVISEQLKASEKSVHKPFQGLYPVDIWNQLTKLYGLLWLYDGTILYVYDSTESITRTIQVHPDQMNSLVSIMNQLGLYSSHIELKCFKDAGIVIASGPPKFIQIIEDLIKNMRTYQQDSLESMDVRLFPLKHAWAADRDIGGTSVLGVASLLDEILGQGGNKEQSSGRLIDPKIAHKVKAIGGLFETPEQEVKQDNNKTPETEKPSQDTIPHTGTISIDTRQNAIIVKDFKKNMPLYEALIAKLDVPLELIEIQAAIVNVDRSVGLTLGANSISFSGGKHSVVIQPFGKESSNNFTGKLQGIVNGRDFLTMINALEGTSQSKLLARPSVITMDNMTAVMDKSSTLYLPVKGTKNGDLYSITGTTKLNVTPHILHDAEGRKQVQLVLDIKDEKLNPGADGEPSVESSSILTQAVVYEGQSVLVGGYFNESFSKNITGIPFLKDVPLIGKLFSSSEKAKSVCERLFLITPVLIELSYSQYNPFEGCFKTPPEAPFAPNEMLTLKGDKVTAAKMVQDEEIQADSPELNYAEQDDILEARRNAQQTQELNAATTSLREGDSDEDSDIEYSYVEDTETEQSDQEEDTEEPEESVSESESQDDDEASFGMSNKRLQALNKEDRSQQEALRKL